MNLPFRPPARVVVERDVIEGVLVEIEHQREQLRSILNLIDTGRSKPARDAKDALLREAMKALKPFSVIADGTDFLGDGQSVSVSVNRCRDARAILSKLTEATKP